MSGSNTVPLLQDYRGDPRQTSPLNKSRNLNWSLIFFAFTIMVMLSVIVSNVITEQINHFLDSEQLSYNEIKRDILMEVTKNNDELIIKGAGLEDDMTKALEEEINAEKNENQALLKRIASIEKKYARLVKESRHEQSNVIWIELTMCGVFFIGSAILFYASNANRFNSSNKK